MQEYRCRLQTVASQQGATCMCSVSLREAEESSQSGEKRGEEEEESGRWERRNVLEGNLNP